jgi:hypothetical protein
MLLLLLACAPSPCERFVEAKSACYEKAGKTDDTPATVCAGSGDDPSTFDALYDCYASAYEASACADVDDVSDDGAAATACQVAE